MKGDIDPFFFYEKLFIVALLSRIIHMTVSGYLIITIGPVGSLY